MTVHQNERLSVEFPLGEAGAFACDLVRVRLHASYWTDKKGNRDGRDREEAWLRRDSREAAQDDDCLRRRRQLKKWQRLNASESCHTSNECSETVNRSNYVFISMADPPTHRARLSHAQPGQPTWQVRWKRWKLSDRLLRDISTRVYVILRCQRRPSLSAADPLTQKQFYDPSKLIVDYGRLTMPRREILVGCWTHVHRFTFCVGWSLVVGRNFYFSFEQVGEKQFAFCHSRFVIVKHLVYEYCYTYYEYESHTDVNHVFRSINISSL